MIKMLSDNNHSLEAVCSVTELAKKLGLSRARFYQLMETGVFPRPVYCVHTKRPFYPLDLQQKCTDIRKTGIVHNGQPILFYGPRKNKTNKSQNQQDHKYKELTKTLRQMGLNVTCNDVKNAVKTLYPERLTEQLVEGTVIRELFRCFKQRV